MKCIGVARELPFQDTLPLPIESPPANAENQDTSADRDSVRDKLKRNGISDVENGELSVRGS